MRRRAGLRKLPVLLLLLVFVAVMFTVPRALSDKASAPFLGIDDGRTGNEPSGSSDVPEVNASPLPTAPSADPPGTVNDIGFITVRMGISDIAGGNLILVNRDIRYDIPDEHGFVAIADHKTSSYMVTSSGMLLAAPAIEALNSMMDAFFTETGNETIAVISGFRDFDKQLDTLAEYTALMGYTEALRWVAPPGFSEHQAGLAVDLGIQSDGALRTFYGEGVYGWFAQNCVEFGFVLRYPEDKTDITGNAHEPWHFRYVGDPHAYIMNRDDLCLEEYIDSVRDFTFEDPLRVDLDGVMYLVYFVEGFDVPVPFDCEFDISGNNVDGFIVTLRVA